MFVESFRPGVVDRLGVGYEQVRARNPRIVYCSISAFGQEGAYRDRPAHDLAVEALSGVISMTLGQDGKPTIPALPLADLLCSLQGLAGILMALLRREKTGKGDYLDMAMHDAMLAGMPNILGPTLAENRQPVARHERTTGGSAFYRLYETADGRHLALGGQEMKFVKNLLGALGRPELAPLCEKPGPHQQPVMEFLERYFGRKRLTENLAFLAPLDVCYAPVNTLPEALDAAADKLLTRRARTPLPRAADPLPRRAGAPEPARAAARRARRAQERRMNSICSRRRPMSRSCPSLMRVELAPRRGAPRAALRKNAKSRFIVFRSDQHQAVAADAVAAAGARKRSPWRPSSVIQTRPSTTSIAAPRAPRSRRKSLSLSCSTMRASVGRAARAATASRPVNCAHNRARGATTVMVGAARNCVWPQHSRLARIAACWKPRRSTTSSPTRSTS